MEEQNKGVFRILLAGLPGVGKRTIKSRFQEDYKLYKDRVKSSKNLSIEDEILRDNLKGRVIELNAIDTLKGQGLEYSPKRDLSSYDIVAFVFDLGEKDSIKRVAQTIFMERQFNFTDLKSRCLKALWGNKKDLFKYFGDSDELTAQTYMKLKADHQMLSYVKSSSVLNNLNNNKLINTGDTKHNEQSPASCSDDPFKCVCQLIEDYFEKTSSQGQSIKSTSQDLSATNQSNSSSSQGYPQDRDGFINHMKKQAKNRTTDNNNLIDSGTSFSRKREKPFPCLDDRIAKNKKVEQKDICRIF